ncbi:MAG: hypothetical protein U5L95_05550 [Candidatus Saccharibacteria bacterium]|nr:hypothetical protein [Candidatus Saccharibacteria bacterium]
MKKNDIALILVIVIVAGIFSFILANFVIAPSSERQAEVENVAPITSEFQRPDEKFFNEKSNNPTQEIRISEGGNEDPFGSRSQ